MQPAIGCILALVALAAAGCGSSVAPAAGNELEEWSEGPVRWLLLPAEWRQLRGVGSPTEAIRFIERFWARRDPDPRTPGNPFRETFSKRVEESDLLYGENGVRGSLTDRGRALILLGPPSRLRITSEEALTWNPRTESRDKITIRQLPLEVWTYRLEDFSSPLALALEATGEATEYSVTFTKDLDRTYLSDGEDLLELAVRTAFVHPE